jgi:hypothetical protein
MPSTFESPFFPAVHPTTATVDITRQALAQLPVNRESAKILSNTEVALLEASQTDRARYVQHLRELILAEHEIARIFKSTITTTMSNLMNHANTYASRLNIAGL